MAQKAKWVPKVVEESGPKVDRDIPIPGSTAGRLAKDGITKEFLKSMKSGESVFSPLRSEEGMKKASSRVSALLQGAGGSQFFVSRRWPPDNPQGIRIWRKR